MLLLATNGSHRITNSLLLRVFLSLYSFYYLSCSWWETWSYPYNYYRQQKNSFWVQIHKETIQPCSSRITDKSRAACVDEITILMLLRGFSPFFFVLELKALLCCQPKRMSLAFRPDETENSCCSDEATLFYRGGKYSALFKFLTYVQGGAHTRACACTQEVMSHVAGYWIRCWILQGYN